MIALRRLFGVPSARAPPPTVESDDIYPVHMLDSSQTLQGIVAGWTLRFNNVLDADMLHASLSGLSEIGDWGKISGRLRLKDNGALEIRVPQSFTEERPAVSYSYQNLAVDIEDHPLAKSLPKATEAASVQPGPVVFRAFAAADDAPVTLDDFIYKNKPQMSLFITSFNNATLVSLLWPHTLMDVMGQQALLRAWSLVLAGQKSEVPPLLGAREDPMRGATDAPADRAEEFKLGQKQLKGWRLLRFALQFGWDLLWGGVMETRTIFLPKRIVVDLKHQAQSNLVAGDGREQQAFISEGDVLTAWSVRAVASLLPQPRPLSVLHVINARFRLSPLLQSSSVYCLSANHARGPLGPIALENRHCLMEQSTEDQVLAFLHHMRSQPGSGRDSNLVCGEPDTLLMPFTNWTRANIFQVADFSPAIIQIGETGKSRVNPPGTMVFHHAQSMRESLVARNVVVVLGKDHGDNYWLTGTLTAATWAKIEEHIRQGNSSTG
ncbi:hypothetical protein BDW62DRAFT_219407 [Aspergillus aurantiobrunneus]